MTRHLPSAIRPLTRAAVAATLAARGVVGVAGVVLIVLYALAVCTVRGQLLENAAVLGSDFAHPDPPWAQDALATIADDRSLLIAMAAVLVLGWGQRRLLTGAVAASTILAANITTQILKNLVFVRPDLVVDPGVGAANSLPSGTVTFLLSTALGLVMVLPRSPLTRPLSLVLPGAAIAAGCATITLDWHRPADVIAGVVVVGVWFAIARSTLDRLHGSRGADHTPTITGLIGCGAIAVVPLLAVLGAPVYAVDPGAHGALVYVTSTVVVALGSMIAIAPLPSLLRMSTASVPQHRSTPSTEDPDRVFEAV